MTGQPPTEEATPELDALLARLEPGPGERAVVTLLVARPAGEDTWLLRYGSVLVGPPAMSSLSWAAWRDADSGKVSPFTRLLDAWGDPVDDWAAFDCVVDGWRAVRFPVEVDDLAGWLARVLVDGVVTTPLGVLLADARPADALFTTFADSWTQAGRLSCAAGRPMVGWRHTLGGDLGEAGPETRPPSTWAMPSGNVPAGAALYLLGMAFEGSAETLPGLVVGRVRGHAWIQEVRGGRPELETFEIRVRLDPSLVSLWELTVDLEETNRDGDMVSARQIRLADVPLPDHGGGDVTVEVPSMGGGLVRRVRLHHVDGTLLDGLDDVRLAESVRLSIAVNGGPAVESVTGQVPAPTLVRRLASGDRIEGEYADWLAAGTAGRVVLAGDAGFDLVRARLAAARGGLCLADAYFGRSDADWDILDRVSVPVRALVGAGKVRPRRPRLAASLAVATWHGSGSVPFHDRLYLWDGGGLVVGTSPNGLGRRLSLVDQLPPHVARVLLLQFETWWADPGFAGRTVL